MIEISGIFFSRREKKNLPYVPQVKNTTSFFQKVINFRQKKHLFTKLSTIIFLPNCRLYKSHQHVLVKLRISGWNKIIYSYFYRRVGFCTEIKNFPIVFPKPSKSYTNKKYRLSENGVSVSWRLWVKRKHTRKKKHYSEKRVGEWFQKLLEGKDTLISNLPSDNLTYHKKLQAD